jgi:hypothetical protein
MTKLILLGKLSHALVFGGTLSAFTSLPLGDDGSVTHKQPSPQVHS